MNQSLKNLPQKATLGPSGYTDEVHQIFKEQIKKQDRGNGREALLKESISEKYPEDIS